MQADLAAAKIDSAMASVVVTNTLVQGCKIQAIADRLAEAFAAGALLTMVADTMLPDSYAVERTWTGGFVVAGFALAVALGEIARGAVLKAPTA